MDQYEQAWEHFVLLCQTMKDEKLFHQMMDLFLTPEEKENLARRYLIIEALIAGERTQRDIAKSLNVSIAKITRGSNELKRIPPKLLDYLKNKIL